MFSLLDQKIMVVMEIQGRTFTASHLTWIQGFATFPSIKKQKKKT